jgi:arginine deiminase
MTFKIQIITAYYFFVFVDHISEEKSVKEFSLFNRDVRKQLSAVAQEAISSGNNSLELKPRKILKYR